LEEKMSEEIKVKKRNGLVEPLQLAKIHDMVSCACEGLSGVSISQVEMTSGIQFYDGISTNEIQEILIKSASDLISLDHPNYQYVAARLLLFSIRKKIYGGRIDMPHLSEHIKKCVNLGAYDSAIYDYYSEEELDEANSFIDHDRDLLFTYAGLRQVVDKYLVQDRVDNILYETPQFMYLLIALTGFSKYPKEKRMSYVNRYYDAISKHKINIPTPILAGVRTRMRQYSSCVLVDVGDSHPSIEASDAAVFRYVAQRAGLGINAGRIRGINSKIRGGEVIHTGVIPYLKKFEATVKSCTQNGIRGGSATVFFPVWHQEIEDIIVLKNNKGTEDNRVRNLDYAIQLSKIFYERFIQDGEITLFSPHNVPGLYEKFGLDGFDELYVKYENDPSIPKKKVKAQSLIVDILKERAETGRIYLMNIDHCNSHGPFKDQIAMSNLCMEILLKTTPIEHIDDVEGSIALCILSCVNVGTIKSDKELEECCDLSVRFLDELIDYQEYPVKAAELTTKASRSLGIGYIGLAHYLAKLGFKYSDPGAWEAIHKLTESFQYYLLKSSNNLAKEKGACDNFKHTKYFDGILPIDTYKKEVDEICNVEYAHNWEQLRQDILEHGLRHTTLSAQPPTESCLFWEHKIKASTGEMDFHQIAEYGGLDWKEIEENDAIGWYDLKKSITVETQDGYKEVDKLYFNGNKEVATITFENGKVIKCTPNHKFLVRLENGSTVWKRVYELNEDDDVVEI
jgi:ribonucleoside-diphosphate reductase alpha chain